MRYAAVIVIVTMMCALGALALRLRHAQTELDRQSEALRDVRAQVETLTAQVTSAAGTQASVDQLQHALDELQKDAGAPHADGTSRDYITPPLRKPKKPSEEADDDETDPGDPAMDAVMRAMDGKMMVDMEYGALLREFSLPAESIRQVRGILAEHITRGQSFYEEDFDPEDEDVWKKHEKAEQANLEQLKRELGAVLTPEEMAQWEDYEENKDRRMLEFQLDTELATFGSAMDDETRQVVRETLAEEMFNDETLYDSESFQMSDYLDAETQQIARARERLAGLLTEEQYQQAEAFLVHKEEMAEANAEWMRHFMEEADRDGDGEIDEVELLNSESDE